MVSSEKKKELKIDHCLKLLGLFGAIVVLQGLNMVAKINLLKM